MRIQQIAVPDALSSLGSGPGGLAPAEAARRISEYGLNRIERPVGPGVLGRLAGQFAHFFALILWVAAACALLAEWRQPGQGMGTLGLAIVLVIFVNGGFSFWQEHRAERALAEMEKLLPRRVRARRGGATVDVPSEELVPGDVVELAEGDDVPADCRVIDASGARVNNATITGESAPQSRDAAPGDEADPLHARNTLLAGTTLVAGHASAVVYATGAHTEFGRIAGLTQSTGGEPSPLQREIARLSKLLAAIAAGMGVVFFVIGQALGLSFWQNLLFAIGIIVANVPEGLLPTVTLALALASQRMARRNALVRHLPAVETLGAATVICTDKTGTITRNQMRVARVWFADEDRAREIGFPAKCPGGDHHRFYEAALHCHDLRDVERNGERVSVGDPMEKALVALGQEQVAQRAIAPRVDEIPFDRDRKRLTTIHRRNGALALYTKGAPESVLPLCSLACASRGIEPLDEGIRSRAARVHEEMAEGGLRVLALAYRQIEPVYDRDDVERELTLCGLVGLEDPVRPEVPDAVRKCGDAGIRVIMITGDHPRTAVAVARETGIVRSRSPVVITGDHLRRMSDIQLQLALDAPEILFARVTADHKLRVVNALKRKGEVVAATGDGVNDAPALRNADIGIAMGASGTDVAREASAMILLDDNFATIVAAVEEGRAVFANIRRFLAYILTSNVPEIVPYLAFVLFRIPLPLTVIQILAVDLGTDLLPALGLGVEPPRKGVMGLAPRPRQEHLLNWPTLLRAYCFLGPIQASAAMAAFFFTLMPAGWRYGEDLGTADPLYLRATTACLSAIVVMQVANAFVCRSDGSSVLRLGFKGTRALGWGIAFEIALILLVVYTPAGNSLVGTAPLPWASWLFILPFQAALLLLEEGRLWLVRRPRGAPSTRAARASASS